MKKMIKSEKIKLGILTVPEPVAPAIARRMGDMGIKAILSFAPCSLAMPHNIEITCVDLSTEMAKLIYYSYR